MKTAICIFAYNEERLLPVCVGAIDAAAEGLDYEIVIMVNGCTDATPDVAKMLAAADPRITVQELDVSDKANAWNDFTHRIAPDAENYIFIDGDITPSAGSIKALADALNADDAAFGAAALPATGRSRKRWARRLFVNHYLSGNLYALSKSAVDLFRKRNIFIPFGAKGEDGIITYLLLTDMKGGRDDGHRHRLVVVPDATFEFPSLEANARDFELYRKRLRRYSERHFQKKILFGLLKARGVEAMPERIYDIYTPDAIAQLQPRRDPVNYLIDRDIIRKLKNGVRPSKSTAL